MTLKRFFILISVLTAFAFSAFAEVSFSVIPPNRVIQGRRFAVTFRLKNGEGSAPKAPQLQGCTLLYGPATSTMMSSTYINGQQSMSSSIDYTFTYQADKAGTVTIPAVSVTVDGKSHTSQTAKFTILPSDDASATSGNGNGGSSQSSGVKVDDVSTQTPGKVSANDLFIKIQLSKTKVYEQEALICTIKLYTKFDITKIVPTTQPSFDGFLSEELSTPDNQLENYNGQNYLTAVLKRVILYPQKAGRLTINSGKFDLTLVQYENVNMGYFTTRRPVEKNITTTTNSATVDVMALPEPKPANFNGAVGKFSVSTKLNPEHLLTNDAATYSYIVKGTGNIKYLKEPTINFPAGFDEYTPKNDINAQFNGSDMTGTYQIDYTIVPQEVGKFTIPGTAFVYFDPSTRQYVTINTDEYNVNVGKGSNASPNIEQKAIDKTMDDILYIKTTHEQQTKDLKFLFNSPLYWCAYLLAVIILIAVIYAFRRQMKLNADVAGRKLAKANKVANKRFKVARTYMNEHKNDMFYEAISQALWGYLSDKLGIPASQLLRDNISEKLANSGASQESIDSVINILDECEMARFTPEHSDEQVAQLYEQAVSAIKQLENIKTVK